jgi:hypothetical protein
MAGPLKRSGYRASPEDAAFYRKYHDSALSAIRKGITREAILLELIDHHVPEETAKRILGAVEQEHAMAAAISPRLSKGKRWLIAIAVIVVFGSASIYVAIQMSQDGKLHAEYLIGAVIGTLGIAAMVILRLFLSGRGPKYLPPPPEPPSR